MRVRYTLPALADLAEILITSRPARHRERLGDYGDSALFCSCTSERLNVHKRTFKCTVTVIPPILRSRSQEVSILR